MAVVSSPYMDWASTLKQYDPLPDVAPPGYQYVSRGAMGGQELVRVGGTASNSEFAGIPQSGGGTGGTATRTSTSRATGSTGLTPKSPTGSVTTQRTTYTGQMPTLELRKQDVRKVAALRQQALAPRLRLLRQAMQRALSRSYENPNERRLIVRSILEGYGTGVEQASAGAQQQAVQQEASNRATENQELTAAYNRALQAYQNSAVTTTTQRNLYDGGTGGTAETGKQPWIGGKARGGTQLPNGRVI